MTFKNLKLKLCLFLTHIQWKVKQKYIFFSTWKSRYMDHFFSFSSRIENLTYPYTNQSKTRQSFHFWLRKGWVHGFPHPPIPVVPKMNTNDERRLIVKESRQKVIKAEVITRTNTGEPVFMPRITKSRVDITIHTKEKAVSNKSCICYDSWQNPRTNATKNGVLSP